MNGKQKIVAVLTVISGLIAIGNAAINYLFPVYLSAKFDIDLGDASAIGVIGGADGPTSILMSAGSGKNTFITAFFTLLTLAGILFMAISSEKRKIQTGKVN